MGISPRAGRRGCQLRVGAGISAWDAARDRKAVLDRREPAGALWGNRAQGGGAWVLSRPGPRRACRCSWRSRPRWSAHRQAAARRAGGSGVVKPTGTVRHTPQQHADITGWVAVSAGASHRRRRRRRRRTSSHGLVHISTPSSRGVRAGASYDRQKARLPGEWGRRYIPGHPSWAGGR